MSRPIFAVRYDYRGPGFNRSRRQELYGRSLEQATYVDTHGFDVIMLSEHHATEDGYLPSPIPVAAAMAARTRHIPITIAALLVNLYEPLRLAEDLAILDHLSRGRVNLTFGLGYRREEYDQFDRDWSGRGAAIEAAITTLRRAWTGQPFTHNGRTVQVLPTPYSDPHPLIFYGGGSRAAARRAARLGLHFQPQLHDPELIELYRAECVKAGRDPGIVVAPSPGPAYIFCASDPEHFWAHYGEYLLADARAYAAWLDGGESFVADNSTTVDELKQAGQYLVLTPQELISRLSEGEFSLVVSHPACGGLPPEPSWESLQLIADDVMPALASVRDA